MKQKLKPDTLCIPPQEDNVNWDSWLINLDTELKEIGYRKFNQNHKSEDFSYFKTFKDFKGNKIYQVGILVYDWRKHIDRDPVNCNRIGISFECYLISEGRIDLSISKDDVSIHKFEKIALTFYQSMSQFLNQK